MKAGVTAFLLAAAAGVLSAPADSTDLIAFDARALPNAPDGYVPTNVSCPKNRPSVRVAQHLSDNEKSWLQKRKTKTQDALQDFFSRVKIDGFDAEGWVKQRKNSSDIPTVGIAASGGGYRAMLNGAGVIAAFDSRTENATNTNQLGGILQSATYVSGLSGGSWLVGSVFLNNFTTIHDLQKNESVWQLNRNILQGPTAHSFFALTFKDTVSYLHSLKKQVDSKKDAHYSTSLTDLWGRALAYQFINDTTGKGGVDYTWSSIAQMDNFKNADHPMPLVITDSRNPDEVAVEGNSTIFEFNPWEFGTFDPTIYGFIPLEYLGSNYIAGKLPDNETCVRGFDNAGYVMGTSATLFNSFSQNLGTLDLDNTVESALEKILKSFDEKQDDIAPYKPNPFYHYANNTNPFAKSTELTLVDGGEDGQNIPLHPLIQPERKVDVIFAIDSSADTDVNWPNGTSLIASYNRVRHNKFINNGTDFPRVPTNANTFVNRGFNERPVFFGCDKNQTKTTPLIVYLPNAPYSHYSNVSTFDLKYKDSERDAIITNGYNVATRGNNTEDSKWSQCVACAMLHRSFARTNTTVPDTCTSCYQKYCWDGKENNTSPASYYPSVMIQSDDDSAAPRMGPSAAAVVAAIAVLVPALL